MANITIPTTSTTQTLTGDNGLTTLATFTANALENPFWGRSGVGLRGNNYDPSNEAALEVDFSNTVQDVQFTLFDVDQATGSWDDQIRVEAYDPDGNPIVITYTTTGDGHVVESNGLDGNLQIEASNNAGDNQSSIVVNIAGPVGSFKIFYEDGTTDTNDAGVINIESMSFSDVTPPDGTVTGSSGDDVIDGSYLGDPNGDRIDDNDAILPGDVGNDDLIYGYAGNDSITAGAGNDEAYGGSGDDTIDGGAGNDLLVGDQSAQGGGQDTITGGAGNDTIYGDSSGDTSAPAGTSTFNWASQGFADGADISGGLTGTTSNGDVSVTLSVDEGTNFTSALMETTDTLYDYDGRSDTSSISLTGGSSGTSSGAAVVTLDFEGNDPGYHDEVSNVSFGIFDLDRTANQFTDDVIIRAYDADGNLVPVTLSTVGDGTTLINTTVNPDGSARAVADNAAVNTNTDQDNGFVQVTVAGPVAKIVVEYANTDPAYGNHAIRIGDLEVTSIPIENGIGAADSLDGGIGDDIIFGQAGDDIIAGGTGDDTLTGGDGSDTFVVENGFGSDTIEGNEDTGDTDVDLLDASGVTTNVTLDLSAVNASDTENGTLTSGADVTTFDNIESIVLGSGDDTVIGSSGNDTIITGDGADTVTMGAGDDVVNLGGTSDISGGVPDGDPDVVVLADGFGDDTVTNFDAPTPAANGRFDGIDTLDVTDLYDAPLGDPTRMPVNTNDVTVTDDGSGNAVLTFPNGESITLIGIPPADADNPFYLNAIGIPLPDGTVSGGANGDVIDGSYLGDPDGDIVDNGDAILPGDVNNDDLIEANGGNDTVFAADGDDEVYGGTGNDTIDGGVGDDTLFGEGGSDIFTIADADGTDAITGGEDAGGTDTDTVSFDGVSGPDGVDVTFTGDEAADYLVGSTGSDGTFTEIERVVGTDNADTVDLSLDTAGITVETGAGDDVVTSGSGDDVIAAGTGDDTIELNDAFGNDAITGGEDAGDTDTDVLDATGVTADTTLDLTAPETGTITDGTDTATLAEIEQFFLGSGDDSATGSTGDDFIDLGQGDDTINAGAGDDSVAAGLGNDEIVLTDTFGNDTVTGGEDAGDTDTDVLNATGVTVDTVLDLTAPETGTLTDGTDTVSLAEIEQFFLGSGDDSATGSVGDDFIGLGAGNDSINAGAGDDTITAGTGNDTVAITNGFGNDTVDAGEDVGNGDVDVLDGSGLTDNVTVNLTGDEVGTVTDGTDTLSFTGVEEIVTGSGDDTITGSLAADSITTGAGDDVIAMGAGDDTIDAGTGDDTITITDGFGNDNITAGEDGAGTDTDVLDGSGLTDDVTVTLTGDEVGTVTDGTDTLDFADVEQIVTGSGDDVVIGGTGDDNVSTGAGNDTITTGAGADTIDAGDGDDVITFSEGDSIDGGDGNDTFTVEDLGEPTNGVITITGGDGNEAPVDPVAQTGGDILRLGDLADLSTLVQTSDGINASGNETFSGTVELDDGTTLNFSGIEQVICFTPGTNIATPHGSRPIETLRVGDMVVTRDHGMQPIRWIQQRTVPAMDKFAPIRLRPGVVTGLERDLLVSPQHRMLFQGYRAELLFGESEVLMPATHLIDDKMVTREEGGFVTYIHMMFDEHEVVYAEGAATESFHPGEVGLTGVTDAAREELFTLFPQLRSDPKGYGRTARRSLKKHESQMLRTT